MCKMLVHGKTAIITGGARGLGRAFCEAILKRGGKVVFADVNESEGKETECMFKSLYGEDSSLFVKCDVTKGTELKDVFRAAKAKFKNVNIVVNNAGILNERLWEKTVDINLTAMIRGTLLAMEHMRKDRGGNGGIVINVASSAGIYPVYFMPAYTASKFGVVGLTRSLVDNPCRKDHGVSFACLCPAFSDTSMVRDTVQSDDAPLMFWNENKDSILRLINKIGINSVSVVEETFVELVEMEDCNGAVATVDTMRGTKYHYKGNKNKL